jgi:hypothetical protein
VTLLQEKLMASPEDPISELDRDLEALEQRLHLKPIEIEDKGYTYILRQESERLWLVKKLDGTGLVAEYRVKHGSVDFYCNCMAAGRGYDCKHKAWVAAVAKLMRRR